MGSRWTQPHGRTGVHHEKFENDVIMYKNSFELRFVYVFVMWHLPSESHFPKLRKYSGCIKVDSFTRFCRCSAAARQTLTLRNTLCLRLCRRIKTERNSSWFNYNILIIERKTKRHNREKRKRWPQPLYKTRHPEKYILLAARIERRKCDKIVYCESFSKIMPKIISGIEIVLGLSSASQNSTKKV